MQTERITLAYYLATYIQEELTRGLKPEDISMSLLMSALDAYEGGAAEEVTA